MNVIQGEGWRQMAVSQIVVLNFQVDTQQLPEQIRGAVSKYLHVGVDIAILTSKRWTNHNG